MASAIYLRIFGVFVPKKGQKQEILQKMRKKLQKNLQIKKYGVPLHSQSKNIAHVNFKCTAEIAQLVEHNLAKVGVASSSLVFRSTHSDNRMIIAFFVRFAEIFRDYIDNPSKPPFDKGGFAWSRKRDSPRATPSCPLSGG